VNNCLVHFYTTSLHADQTLLVCLLFAMKSVVVSSVLLVSVCCCGVGKIHKFGLYLLL
jgi:hypothetical protein